MSSFSGTMVQEAVEAAWGSTKSLPERMIATKDRADSKTKRVTLALQGGGTHGAFSWGVLDYLLEDGRLDIEGMSATSAGAVNATLCAFGMLEGGREGARKALHDFWRAVADAGAAYRPMTSQWLAICSGAAPIDRTQLRSLFAIPRKALATYLGSLAELNPFLRPFVASAGSVRPRPSRNLASLMFHTVSSMLSPYYFNPANYNPLKVLLEKHVDFDSLRAAHGAVKLYICATNVETGKIRIFRNSELTAEAIIASSCVPFLFQAARIDGEFFWDGGSIGNPAIFPLIYDARSRDVVIVHLEPVAREGCPTTFLEIMNRFNEVSFNSSLMREMRAIAFINGLVEAGKIADDGIRHMLLHAIRADMTTLQLGALSKVDTSWEFLRKLFVAGRAAAAQWLDENYEWIGRESTIDLEKDYL
jgi:NTE family protein